MYVISFVLFFACLAIGVVIGLNQGGYLENFKENLKERRNPPPPPRIDPHAPYRPPATIQVDDQPIIERDPYTPEEDEVKWTYTPTKMPCPFCGEKITIDQYKNGVHEYNTSSYIYHILERHRSARPDPHTVPCAVCSIYSWWSDDMGRSGVQTPNPYCEHCGGLGFEPVTVEIIDGKEVVRRAKVVISDNDILVCPECENVNSRRIKCTLCERTGAMTRGEIKKMKYSAPKYYVHL